MSDLIVAAFDDEFKAEQVRLDLLRLKHEHLVDLEEAAIVVRTAEGKVRIHHAGHLTVPAALTGGFVGTLVGLMLINPALALLGLVSGTALGAVIGALKEVGIDEKFMKKLAAHLKPGSSALFVLVKQTQPDVVVNELKRFNGHVLQTPLAHQDEAKLREALEAVRKDSGDQ
jgi:uncharacterized membrane protein